MPLFGRQSPARESVNEDLPAAPADSGAGNRLQSRRQGVGVIRQRVEVSPAQHDGVRVLIRVGAQPGLRGDDHLALIFEHYAQLNIEWFAPGA